MNTKLIPTDSFNDLINMPILNNLEDYLKEVNIWPSMRSLVNHQMKVDVSETDTSYLVKADLPGVEKKDIKVSVHGNQVSISCEIKKNKEEKQGETIIRSERHSGKLYRSFTLGTELDEKKATAKYQDGILDLTLPKKAESERIKEIPIN